jgi:hypothetical protein
MALKTPLSTPGDVRNLREEIYSSVRDDQRLLSHIFRSDSIIRARLSGFYTETALEDSAPWNSLPQARIQQGNVDSNLGSGILSDVNPASTADTELWTITFGGVSTFSVISTLGGGQGSGNTGTVFTSTNAKLVIPVANWSGTPQSGDQFYVSTYKHRPLIVTLSAIHSAYLASADLFRGERGLPPEVETLNRDFKAIMDALASPYKEGGMRLDSFAERDISPEGVGYVIGSDGTDLSTYADNEQTPWDDSFSLSFLNGPIWL